MTRAATAAGVAVACAASIVPAYAAPVAAQSAGSFTISGSANGPMAPGVVVPIDLRFDNPHPFALSITDVRVAVAGVSAIHADAQHPCSAEDFQVQQIASTAAIAVSADSSQSLSDLGFVSAQWPAVSMLNRPVNQDGCKGVSLTLAYTATAIAAGTPPGAGPQPAGGPSPAGPSAPSATATPSRGPATPSASLTPSQAPAAAGAPGDGGPPRTSGGEDRPALLQRVFDAVADGVIEATPAVLKGARIPLYLLPLVLLFLVIQNEIDRRDPKLALAPSYPDADLPFDYDPRTAPA